MYWSQMREKIEAGSRDARWEFSKTVLFERTTHQAAVCTDLAACVQTFATFRRFLSPDLRIVTGDTPVRLIAACAAHWQTCPRVEPALLLPCRLLAVCERQGLLPEP